MFDLSYWQKRFFPSSDRCLHICWSETDPRDSVEFVDSTLGAGGNESFPKTQDRDSYTFQRLGESKYPFLFVELGHTMTRRVKPHNIENYLFTELDGGSFRVRRGWLPSERAGELVRDVFVKNRGRQASIRRYEKGVISFEMELLQNELLNYLCIARDPIPAFVIETNPAHNLPVVA